MIIIEIEINNLIKGENNKLIINHNKFINKGKDITFVILRKFSRI